MKGKLRVWFGGFSEREWVCLERENEIRDSHIQTQCFLSFFAFHPLVSLKLHAGVGDACDHQSKSMMPLSFDSLSYVAIFCWKTDWINPVLYSELRLTCLGLLSDLRICPRHNLSK